MPFKFNPLTGQFDLVNASGVGGGVAISASTVSQSTGTVNFSNSNGVSFGLNTNGVITATVQTNYITTAMASNRGSDFIQATAAFAGTSASGTIASNGISVSIGPYITTGALSNHSHGVSFTSGSVVFQTLSFTNSNGFSFNSSTQGIFGSYTVPSVTEFLTTAALSNHSHGNPTLALTNITGTTASASNGLTLSLSGNLPQTVQPVAASGSNGSFLFSTLQFVTGNGATFVTDATGIRLSYTVPAATVFSNSNNVTFGLNGSTVTASASYVNDLTSGRAGVGETVGTVAGTDLGLTVNTDGVSILYPKWITTYAAGGGDAIRGIAANGSTASTNTVHFSNSNNISFGFGAAGNSTVLTADVGLAASDSAGSFTFKTLNFSNANNVTFGTSAGGIITASVAAAGGGATISYFNIVPQPNATHTTSWAQSTSHVVPFRLEEALSMDRVRVLYSGSVAASSTQATTAGTSLSMSGRTSHNFVFYSRGVVASSLSLQYVTSTQIVDQQLFTFSAAANSTQMSFSNRYTLGTHSVTKDYSNSTNSILYHTSNLTDLTGARYIDLPAALFLSSKGLWWVAYGRSTTMDTQNASISVATRMIVSHNSQIGVSLNTLAIGMIGSNTNSSVGFFPGHGSFTTAGGGTTSSIPMANISTAASNHLPFFQFMRIT